MLSQATATTTTDPGRLRRKTRDRRMIDSPSHRSFPSLAPALALAVALGAFAALAPPAAAAAPADAAAADAAATGAAHGLPVQLSAGAPSPAPGGGWRRVPIWGADVRSLAAAPDDLDTVFAGTSGGHVYVTRDGGRSWDDAGASLPLPGWVVSDLLFDPERPGRLWAALWGVWGSGQVVVSDDGGQTWLGRGDDLSASQVYTLAAVPGRPDRLYAGTLSGVWATDDAGLSWRRLTSNLPEVHKVTSLLVGPDPGTVIAGTWERAYRSDDGGRTWRGIFDGMILDSEVFSLTPVAGRPGEIWASTCGWVYQTLDGGGSWKRYQEGFEQRRTPSFEALPGGRLLAGTVQGLHVSDDGGRRWRRTGPKDVAIHDVEHHPRRPERVFLATEGSGVWVSNDGGTTLERAARGMTNVHAAAMARAGDALLVAVNHAGPASGIYSSRDGGRTFAHGGSTLPTVLGMTVHGPSVYAATEKGLWERSGDAWRRIGEVGEGRVEQVVSEGGRLVARTADALWELDGLRFRKVPYAHGLPRSATLAGGAVWVTDREALYRLTSAANDTVAAPFPGGEVERFADGLLLSGKGGAYFRPAAGATSWVRLADGPARALATGDARYPALVLTAEGLALAEAGTGRLHPVDFPFRTYLVSSAAVLGGRLLVGTAGQGLLWTELPPAAEGPLGR